MSDSTSFITAKRDRDPHIYSKNTKKHLRRVGYGAAAFAIAACSPGGENTTDSEVTPTTIVSPQPGNNALGREYLIDSEPPVEVDQSSQTTEAKTSTSPPETTPLLPSVELLEPIEVRSDETRQQLEASLTIDYDTHTTFKEMVDPGLQTFFYKDYQGQQFIEGASPSYDKLSKIQANLVYKSEFFNGEALSEWLNQYPDVTQESFANVSSFEIKEDELEAAKDDPIALAKLINRVHAGIYMFGDGEKTGFYVDRMIHYAYIQALLDPTKVNEEGRMLDPNFWNSKLIDQAQEIGRIGTDSDAAPIALYRSYLESDLALNPVTNPDFDQYVEIVVEQGLPEEVAAIENPTETILARSFDKVWIIEQQTANHSNPFMDPSDGNNYSQYIFTYSQKDGVHPDYGQVLNLWMVTPGVEEDSLQFILIDEEPFGGTPPTQ